MMCYTFYQDSLNWGHMYTLNYPSSMPANNKSKFEITTEQFWNIGISLVIIDKDTNKVPILWLEIDHSHFRVKRTCVSLTGFS